MANAKQNPTQKETSPKSEQKSAEPEVTHNESGTKVSNTITLPGGGVRRDYA